MNYFIEGLQGAGKSTLVQQLSDKYPKLKVFREGDYSPVELAWCAFVTTNQYEEILRKYSDIENEIKANTFSEQDRKIICYTRIRTDNTAFYKDLEKYEIYNGNLGITEFEGVVLSRFKKWNGNNQVFECAVFQNIIENLMLYLELTDEEIVRFYSNIAETLSDKNYKIIYLDAENITSCIDTIKRERIDNDGNEVWYSAMIRYIENAPYSKKHSLNGLDGLITHLERRRALEHRIIEMFFDKNTIILRSKQFDFSSLEIV
ncbi:MAG: deoxynucleoside kinase [Ruminococcaceae bacterium]|nr:deoxynucleoside kinase [Oscillospiraceae bacterium]